MPQKIQVKRGVKANLPILSSGEPALTTDTEEVFFGNGLSNIQLVKKSDLDKYVRNDQDSTINGKLSVFNNSQFLSLQSTGETSLGGELVKSNYVLTPIDSLTGLGGEIATNGGLELKQIGITDLGRENIVGLLKLSLDLNLNGNLSINNNNLVSNLNAELLNGKKSSDFILKNENPPTTSTSNGVKGMISLDSNYIYICTAINTWKRIPFQTGTW